MGRPRGGHRVHFMQRKRQGRASRAPVNIGALLIACGAFHKTFLSYFQ
jgi:hypothetical protein